MILKMCLSGSVKKLNVIFSSSSEKEMKSVSSQTEGTVTIITVGNPPNSSFSGGNVATIQQRNLPPSNMSSEQSLAKSSR